jgi:hypothetical protein
VLGAAFCLAAASYRPDKVGAFISSDGTGNDGTWVAMAGAGGLGTPVGRVKAVGLYYSSDGTGNDGTWLPCGSQFCFAPVAPVSLNSAGCRPVAPVAVTGDTSAHQVLSCLIPAGYVNKSSAIGTRLWLDPCTASNVPYTGCGGANVANTSFTIYLSATATGVEQPIRSSAFACVITTKSCRVDVNTQFENSLSSQISEWTSILDSSSPRTIPGAATTLNFGAAAYLNVFLINGNNTDKTFLAQANVVITP